MYLELISSELHFSDNLDCSLKQVGFLTSVFLPVLDLLHRMLACKPGPSDLQNICVKAALSLAVLTVNALPLTVLDMNAVPEVICIVPEVNLQDCWEQTFGFDWV